MTTRNMMNALAAESGNSNDQQGTPQWVTEMHEHFCQHGFYRGTDLQRVLGEPDASVADQTTEAVGFRKIA